MSNQKVLKDNNAPDITDDIIGTTQPVENYVTHTVFDHYFGAFCPFSHIKQIAVNYI